MLKTSSALAERLGFLRMMAERAHSRATGQRSERDALRTLRSNTLAKGERPDPALARDAERADTAIAIHEAEARAWSMAHRTAAAWLDSLADDTWLADTGWTPRDTPPASGADPRHVLGVALEGEAPERRSAPAERESAGRAGWIG